MKILWYTDGKHLGWAGLVFYLGTINDYQPEREVVKEKNSFVYKLKLQWVGVKTQAFSASSSSLSIDKDTDKRDAVTKT